ncbi:ABC transporter permease subunit [Yinghuangia seranimata]|uniref:ABC transporter permease subunit n=1 Tax=Yinghuangia seranimata TaxID=408067 RepID=UPI00248BA4DE|nr:hypothetical protein [Yinghuangia seranimata]MDI2130687.1 hypothetical protein [Yinghuangia seranimata]
MLWMTWRQHRAHLLSCLALLAVAALALGYDGYSLHTQYTDDGVGACARHLGEGTPACKAALRDFLDRADVTDQFLDWMMVVPGVVGALLGALLVAPEFEQGTWRMAWTQAVPRTRWLAWKLGFVVVVAAGFSAALAALVGWYRAPLDEIRPDGRFASAGFDLEGVVLPAYTVFAVALGALAGLLLRRTVAAVALAVGVFVVVRLSVETLVRPHYWSPVSRVGDPELAPTGVQAGDWTLAHGWQDLSGRNLSHNAYRAIADGATPDYPGGFAAFLRDHGVVWWQTYQPASRFGAFQLVEAGLYMVLSAGLVAGLFVALRRRTG